VRFEQFLTEWLLQHQHVLLVLRRWQFEPHRRGQACQRAPSCAIFFTVSRSPCSFDSAGPSIAETAATASSSARAPSDASSCDDTNQATARHAAASTAPRSFRAVSDIRTAVFPRAAPKP
jgi:hypothetical protein